MNNELHQALNSTLDVLHLNISRVDAVIDLAIDMATTAMETTDYPPEALSVVKKRAEAIREAVKNNPLPERPSCKQLAQ